MAYVRKSVKTDHTDLAPRLREADQIELNAHNATAELALGMGFTFSRPCLTIEHEGRPISMFGVTPVDGVDEVGQVWLLGSDEINDIRVQFLRESKRWLKEISTGYELLCNVVHEGNILHHRWLRFLGFRFLNHHPPFFEFARFV